MNKESIIEREPIFFELPKNRSAAIKVIGVGGGGSNAVAHMYEQGITGVNFVICNTDAQALNNNPVPIKIQLGASITEGLGAGADPEIGEKAALESLEDIKNLLDANTKMVFITAGMGGGTGTGAAPIISSTSKEKGILTVGIVTLPFYFEGRMRLEQAQKGIEVLRKNVDSLIVINNDKLRELYGNLGFKSGFAKADEVLTTAAKGIAEVITHHYKQNIDLRDARTVLKQSGTAIMGSAVASGEARAKEAAIEALDSPLLNDNKITGAKHVLLLIVSGKIEITIDEIGIISDYIQAEAQGNANIIMGIGEDEMLEEGISVTVVATGFPTEVQRSISHEEKKIFYKLEEDNPFNEPLPSRKRKKSNPTPPLFKQEEIDSLFIKDSSYYDHHDKKNPFPIKEEQENEEKEQEDENSKKDDFHEGPHHYQWKVTNLDSSKEKTLTIENIDLFIDEPIENKPYMEKFQEEPIPEELKRQIKEQKERIENSSYRPNYPNELLEKEGHIPAYKRKKIELDKTKTQKDSFKKEEDSL